MIEKKCFKSKKQNLRVNQNANGIQKQSCNIIKNHGQGLIWRNGSSCYVYVDDILVFGEDESVHDAALIKICNVLSNAEFQANREKVECKKEEVVFLGHFISHNEIEPYVNPKQGMEDY